MHSTASQEFGAPTSASAASRFHLPLLHSTIFCESSPLSEQITSSHRPQITRVLISVRLICSPKSSRTMRHSKSTQHVPPANAFNGKTARARPPPSRLPFPPHFRSKLWVQGASWPYSSDSVTLLDICPFSGYRLLDCHMFQTLRPCQEEICRVGIKMQ